MTQVRVRDDVHKKLKKFNDDSNDSSLSASIESLLEEADSESDLYDRLGLSESTKLPEPVGNDLYGDSSGVSAREENIPRVARFFVSGMWMLNEQFASQPEYVDIVLINKGALIRHHGSAEQGNKVTHFFVSREHYDNEVTTMLRSGSEFLLPPGGMDIKWRSYPGTIELPTRAVEWGGSSHWAVIGYGFGETTHEDVSQLNQLRTVEEAITLDGKTDKKAYEKRIQAYERRVEQAKQSNSNSVPAVSGIHVDSPTAVFEEFFSWCLSRADWSPRDGLESPQDVFDMAPEDILGLPSGTQH